MAYGWLHLLPVQFYALTPMELDRMAECRARADERTKWETAYWVACLMSVHTRKPVRTEKLMKPFLPKKTSSEIAAERDAFFEEFRRKGADGNGNHR